MEEKKPFRRDLLSFKGGLEEHVMNVETRSHLTCFAIRNQERLTMFFLNPSDTSRLANFLNKWVLEQQIHSGEVE